VTPEYLSTAEVVARWNGHVSEQTLRQWRMIPDRGPPFAKFGSKVLYPLARLAEWEAKQVRT
jgi:hypothetical protein